MSCHPLLETLPTLTCRLRNVASGKTNIGQLPIRQSSQLPCYLTGADPVTKAGENDGQEHNATSTISRHKRIRAAHRQREKRQPNWMAELRDEPRHREAVAEERSSTAHEAWDKPKRAQTCPDERTWNA